MKKYLIGLHWQCSGCLYLLATMSWALTISDVRKLDDLIRGG